MKPSPPVPRPLSPAPPRRALGLYCLLPTAYCPRRSRTAFTLVEMLIALALTLILVYAIAHFYAIVGDAVKDGRSMIEMNQQLRAVVQRLKSDLDQVTVPVVPWADEGGAAGYFTYREGAASDADVNADNFPDAEFNFLDVDNDGKLDGFDVDRDGTVDVKDVSNLLGDCDDFLGLTIRAAGTPFTGRAVQALFSTNPSDGQLIVPTQTQPPAKISNPPMTVEATAPYAEVVWWTSFADNPDPTTGLGDGIWNVNEPRFLHRRQLLIRPDLNQYHPSDPLMPSTPYYFKIPTPGNLNSPLGIWQYDVHQYCDVSIRPLTSPLNTPGYLYFVANSLADLSKRENRFMHVPAANDPPQNPGLAFPYMLDLNPNFAGSLRPDFMPDNANDVNTTAPRHMPNNTSLWGGTANYRGGSQYRWVLMDGGRKGEDIMLPNVLAFDIRVFDPDAVVRPDAPSAASGVLQPGDPGYAYANSNNFSNTHAPYGGATNLLPTGAYVDLGYGIALANMLPNLPQPHRVPGGNSSTLLFDNVFPGLGNNVSPYQPTLGSSRFANFPATNASLPNPIQANYRGLIGYTYDTWTLAYERDGINQDGDADAATGQPLIDEGRDGLDNLVPNGGGGFVAINGVDDAAERETTPPYPHALRGIQIRVRMYEPGTRQMRQATVIGDFLNE